MLGGGSPDAGIQAFTRYAPGMLAPMLVVSVGNTRTRFARVEDGKLEPSRVVDNADAAAGATIIDAASGPGGALPVLMASVNDPEADRLERVLEAAGSRVSRFVRDVPIPIQNTLDDDSTVGQDRLLDALGAFARSQQACIVVDAGTAVTVDFVDGQGVFHGGAIAPGATMMLRAMHEQTAALPKVQLSPETLPGSDAPFGKTTAQAMALGAASAVRGLVHTLIDRYAEFYGAYPRVVATGGDAALLFENDDLVEHIVPDLTLVGMVAAAEAIDKADEHDEDDDA
jgi:type III pantothenate kinase